ncbi:AmmeMemoRadiSam system protein B [uncultured Maribacter sp.]|uniref:AmmeMemoRadiSam system protein B n=1 Tax=uncultured Maribacter sp. TaxID=431308 RepID=UPI0030D7A857|tara:strand:- start:251 stop:1318 length:1068 start_codon:yes stop_codon:yes gene_type:complete
MKDFIVLLFISLFAISCKQNPKNDVSSKPIKIREANNYAKHDWQMDSIYNRLDLKDSPNNLNWKTAITPHDNYRFAGQLYYKSLRGINAPNIILIGVAHRARNYELQDKLIFGTFTEWESPYGGIKVSSLNDEIISHLPEDNFVVHDSMQVIEHSLEAIIPWLHKKNRKAEIVPILVPYINYTTIDYISQNLAKVVHNICAEKNWEFGKDVAIVISNDAVHYGDLEWGDSKNMAPMGTDSVGTQKAVTMDLKIINDCLSGTVTNEKIKMFTEYTVQKNDYKQYKWVWCGRYSVPFGMSFANNLNILENQENLQSSFLGYQTSIDHPLIEVEDLGMEVTALSTNRHWVAYTSIIYQ